MANKNLKRMMNKKAKQTKRTPKILVYGTL